MKASAVLKSKGIGLFLVLALSACTGERMSPKTHSMGETVALTGSSEVVSAPEISEILKDQNALRASGLTALNGGAERFYTQAIAPLRERIMNEEVLLDGNNNTIERDILLRRYNENVLRFVAAVGVNGDERLNSLLTEYESLVSYGCAPPNYSRCVLIPLFRRAANSFDVWKLIIARNLDDLDKTRERIRLGWRLGNNRQDNSMEQAYLALAPALERDLEAKNASDAEVEEHYRWVNLATRITVGPSGTQLRSSAAYQNYLREIITREAPTSRIEVVRRHIRSQLIADNAAFGLLAHDWFISTYSRRSIAQGNEYKAALERIRQMRPRVLQNFSITPLAENSKEFVILNSLYTGLIAPQVIRQLLESSGLSPESIAPTIKSYVEVLVLSLAVNTSKEMGEFFKDRSSFRSSNIHYRAVEKFNQLKTPWLRLYTQISRIDNAAQLVFGVQSSAYRNLKINQDNLNETVEYLLNYPFMMMLVYQMAENQFVLRGFFYGNITHHQVIEWFFDGKLGGSFFDFALRNSSNRFDPGRQPLNPTDLIYALHFALRAEVFEAFDVDTNQFIERLGRDYLRGSLERVRTYYRNWETPRQSLRALYNQAVEFCAAERQANPEASALHPNGQGSRQNIELNFNTLTETILISSEWGVQALSENEAGGGEGSGTRYGLKIHSHEHEQSLEVLRVGLGNRLQYISDMVNVYRQHLRSTGLTENALEDVLKRVTGPLNEALHEKRRFLTTAYSFLREFTLPCVPYLIRREFNLTNEVIRRELNHYRQIYRDFHRLKAISLREGKSPYQSESAEVKAILERYKIPGYESLGYSGFDVFNIDSGNFLAHRMDANFRIAAYLQRGQVTDSENLPALLPRARIVMPSQGIRYLEIFEKRVSVTLNPGLAASEEEFAASALRAVHTNSYHRDEGLYNYITRADYYFRSSFERLAAIVAAIGRMGEAEVYSSATPQCLGAEIVENCQVEKRNIEDEEIRVLALQLMELAAGTEADHELFRLMMRENRGTQFSYSNGNNGLFVTYNWGNGVSFNPLNLNPLAIFDLSYELARTPKLGFWRQLPWAEPREGGGSSPDDTQVTPLDRAVQFRSSQIAEPMLLYSVLPEVSQELLAQYRSRVQLEFSYPKRVEAIAQRQREADARAGIERVYRVRTVRGPETRGYYLNPTFVEDQAAVESQFHLTTNGLFR